MPQIKQTCSVTNGSQAVQIAGVDLTARIKKNYIFMVDGLLVPYTVAADSTFDGANTNLTLTGAYADATNPTATGVFVTDYTYPDMVPTIAQGDVGTAAIFTKAMYRLQSMIGSVDPAGFSKYETYYNEVQTMHDDVATMKANAADSATSASNSANAAATSASNAQASQNNAASSASASQAWATQTSGEVVVGSGYGAKKYANDAAASATNAASSASAADTSKTMAGTSETNAANSANAAASSKSAAASSASDAATSASNASSSQTAAATSATNAKTSETSAATSATNASTSESNALSSKNAAATSASNAATSESNAKTSETNASTSASNASTSATAAQDWATKTASEVVAGQGYGAKKYANDASASATNAASSASSAQTQATNASNSASAASTSATNASTSETNAKTSETNAASSANAASTSATNASNSASSAATQATNASGSATTAQDWATKTDAEVVAGQGYGAKYYAQQAANSASQAQAGQVQADWTQADTTNKGFILNKPTLAAVATSGNKADVGLGNVDNTSDANKPVSSATQTALNAKIDSSLMGAANGVATLDGTGKVPAAQLPSYVDDVLEYANTGAFPATGASGVIYVADDTNKTYRWSGSTYIEISASPGSTDAVPEGANNKYFTESRVLNTILNGLSTATNAVISATDSVLGALGKLQAQITANVNAIASKAAKGANSDITSLSGLTTALSVGQGGTGATTGSAAMASFGFGNVENKSSAQIRADMTLTDVTTALAYTPSRQAGAWASGAANASLYSVDLRTITNPSAGIGYAHGGRFRFSFANDADTGAGYADVIDLSTYTDSSGGGYNSLYFNKNSQQIQHKWAAAGGTAWTVKTVAYTDSNITGTAANVTGTVAVANGGTGATTAAAALTNLGAAPSNAPTFTGLISANGTRPLTYDPSIGAMTLKGNAAGWAMGWQFQGSGGTSFGGFYGYGNADTMSWYAVGDAYNSGWLTVFRSTGNTVLGSTTDDGANRLQVNGSAKVSGNVAAGSSVMAQNGGDGQVSVGGDGNGSIEIGKQGRAAAGTPYIDMHSSANSGDFDVRIMASGGSSSSTGQGSLAVTAAGGMTLNGAAVLAGTAAVANGGTGATNAVAALNNLGAFGAQNTALGNGVDLNTLQTTGLYYQTLNTNASGGTNYPSPQAGKLEVYSPSTSFVYQAYHVYNTSDVYVRALYNGTWQPWHKQLTEATVGSYAPSLTGAGASGTWGIAAKNLSGADAFTNGTDGWWRSNGGCGWYNATYSVGIYATEAGNVRTYNGANFISGGNVTASGYFSGPGTNLTGTAASLTAGNASSISSAVGASYTWTGAQYFKKNYGSTATVTASSTQSPGMMAFSDDNGPAVMAFLRSGQYGVNMGLDTDNVIRIGGWSAGANIYAFDMSGNFTAAGNVTAYSDERLKKNWRDVAPGFIEAWAQVKHGIFERIDTGETQLGLGAQSVQKILPDAINTQADGYLTVNYGAASAVATVKLAQRVVELEQRLLKQEAFIKLLMEKAGY